MIETWFKIALSSFIPIVVAFLLPKQFRIYPLIVAGLLMITAVITMLRQERRKPPTDNDGQR
jgi:VIT1/CCC1 family predicted Fe2+/Mn2+ transporter